MNILAAEVSTKVYLSMAAQKIEALHHHLLSMTAVPYWAPKCESHTLSLLGREGLRAVLKNI